MSLGLPGHLSRKANSKALAGAMRVGGLAALGFGAVCTLLPGNVLPGVGPAGAGLVNAVLSGAVLSGAVLAGAGLAAMVLLAAMFVILVRHHTVPVMIAALLVGAVCTFVYALTLLTENPSFPSTQLFVFAFPIVALTLIGGTGSGSLTGVIWATAGYVVGQGAVFVAALVSDRRFVLGLVPLMVYLLVVAVLALDGLTRNLKRDTQRGILRQVRFQQADQVRARATADAAADLHDTVLSHLTVLAHSTPGTLAPRLRERIEASLAGWGGDRAAELAREEARARNIEESWAASGLASALENAADEGLTVTVSGDRGAVGCISAERRRALALAVRQCLANVLLHSGQTLAELTISATDEMVSVMVVDAGRGFDPARTPTDRMGLNYSVRDRIERVGGQVSVFSRPGAGTSVSLLLPLTPDPPNGPGR